MEIKKFLNVLLVMFISISTYAQTDLVISEIMYNPPESGVDSLEYVEIYNNGSESVNLLNYSISGATYTFPSVILGSGEFVVVAKDSIAMVTVFDVNAYQWLSGALSNIGESIVLKDASDQTVDSIRYSWSAPWPAGESQGQGRSITLCDYLSDNNAGDNWTLSTSATGVTLNSSLVFGSPGRGDVTCDITTGLSNVSTEVDVEVYPNPVQNEVFVNLKTLGVADVSLLDISGVLIQSSTITSGENSISLEGLESGVYMLKIQSGDAFDTHKIVKE